MLIKGSRKNCDIRSGRAKLNRVKTLSEAGTCSCPSVTQESPGTRFATWPARVVAGTCPNAPEDSVESWMGQLWSARRSAAVWSGAIAQNERKERFRHAIAEVPVQQAPAAYGFALPASE